MTPASDNFLHQTGSLTTWKCTETYIIQLQNTYKKVTAKFSINHKKTGIILIIFIMVLMISFLLLYKLSEWRIL